MQITIMITREEIEKIIKDIFNGNFEYIRPDDLVIGEFYSFDNKKGLDFAGDYHSLFPGLISVNEDFHNYYKYEIDKDVYLIASYAYGQFLIDVVYYGVSINLYNYYNATGFYGFNLREFYSKLDFSLFNLVSKRNFWKCNHEMQLLQIKETDCVDFIKLIIDDETLLLNRIFKQLILGTRTFNFNEKVFKKICIKKIIISCYVYSFTEKFGIPESLEEVILDLTKDKYNSVKEQKLRIIQSETLLVPFMKSEKTVGSTLKTIYDLADQEISILLNYDSDKGVVLSNMYIYKQLPKDLVNSVKMKKLKDKEFAVLDKFIGSGVGYTEWYYEYMNLKVKQ